MLIHKTFQGLNEENRKKFEIMHDEGSQRAEMLAESLRKNEGFRNRIVEKLREIEEIQQLNTGEKFKCELYLHNDQIIKINFSESSEEVTAITIEFLAVGFLIIDEHTAKTVFFDGVVCKKLGKNQELKEIFQTEWNGMATLYQRM